MARERPYQPHRNPISGLKPLSASPRRRRSVRVPAWMFPASSGASITPSGTPLPQGSIPGWNWGCRTRRILSWVLSGILLADWRKVVPARQRNTLANQHIVGSDLRAVKSVEHRERLPILFRGNCVGVFEGPREIRRILSWVLSGILLADWRKVVPARFRTAWFCGSCPLASMPSVKWKQKISSKPDIGFRCG